ncbi:MAG: gliding motility-associated C-terminal domain-containing protein, partial [Bacteroidota bacterium]
GSTPINDVSFAWTTTNGNILLGNLEPNPEVDLAGDYLLTLTNDINGCTATESISIFEDFAVPQIGIATPETLTCVDTVITLSAVGSSVGFPFENTWSTITGNILSGTNTLEAEVDAAGIYTLNILNTENGCAISESVEVLANVVLPFVNAGGVYEMGCTETEITLDAIAAQGSEFTYAWTTTDGNILNGNTTLAPTVVIGNYLLTVTNQINGCENISEAQVVEDMDVPNDIEVILTDPLCRGDGNGSIEILNVIGGEAPYVYAFDDQTFSTNNTFTNLGGSIYPLTVQDATGCEWSTTLELIDPNEIVVELGPDQFIELGENITLQAINNIPSSDLDSIAWLSSGALDCNNCLTQNILPLFTTTYSVWLSNTNGCETEDNVTVFVNNPRRIFIPNAFSPDGDGYNDVFMIYAGLGVAEIEQFQIFSRWGELVFEQNNFQPNDTSLGWNGFFRGEKMNPGVLVYFAKVRYLNGKTEIFKGDVYLK